MNIEELEETDEEFRGKKVYREDRGYREFKVIVKRCNYCNDKHTAIVKEVRNNDRGKYCSNSCSSKAIHEEREWSGENNPAYKGKIDYIEKIKKNSKCEGCGLEKEELLDFHHKEPTEKVDAVANMKIRAGYDLQDLKNEVDKCKILCANCHRLEHLTGS